MKKLVFIGLLFLTFNSKSQIVELDSVFKDFAYHKSVLYIDTGFVILSKPDFLCYFISTNDTSIEHLIQTSKYSRYCYIQNEDFENLFFDKPIKFVFKNCDSCNIMLDGRTYQYGVDYFRAVVSIEVPMFELKYASPNEYRFSEHLFRIKDQMMNVYPIFKSYINVFKCTEIIPMSYSVKPKKE